MSGKAYIKFKLQLAGRCNDNQYMRHILVIIFRKLNNEVVCIASIEILHGTNINTIGASIQLYIIIPKTNIGKMKCTKVWPCLHIDCLLSLNHNWEHIKKHRLAVHFVVVMNILQKYQVQVYNYYYHAKNIIIEKYTEKLICKTIKTKAVKKFNFLWSLIIISWIIQTNILTGY